MANTSTAFLALAMAEDSTIFVVTIGGISEYFVSSSVGDAVELAAAMVAWGNDAARGWAPGKVFVTSWAALGTGAVCTLSCNFPFDLTWLSGPNRLQLVDCVASTFTAGATAATGTWCPPLLRLQPESRGVGKASSPRAMTAGGPVRSGAAGTGARQAVLEAAGYSADVVRLSDCFDAAVHASATCTHVALAGTETRLCWQPISMDRDVNLYRVRMPVVREV